MNLYHYTCDHGHAGIAKTGTVIPGGDGWAWFTDLDAAHRQALGLTSHTLACDRTRHRWQAADDTTLHRWVGSRWVVPRALREALESAPGVMPMHWWVSTDAVPVVPA